MTKFKDKNILITGGLGFIGSHLARALVQKGANVFILDSMIPEYGGNLFNIDDIKDKVTINFSDIRDVHSLKYLVQNKDYIFNLAGQVSHIDSMEDPVTDLDINCKSQLMLLETCRHHNPKVKIIYAGTRQVYGKPKYLPVDEKHLVNPVDINGINKVAGEYYHILYHNVYGIKCNSLRLTNTYGPGQLIKHNKQGFAGFFVKQAIQGETIKIFGDGKQLRDFNYVTDVVDAMIGLAQSNHWGEIFNLGAPTYYSLLDFVKILKKFCNFKYEIVPFPSEKKKIDIGDYYSDYSKLKKCINWEPKIDLEEGLKKTVNFYKKNLNYYI